MSDRETESQELRPELVELAGSFSLVDGDLLLYSEDFDDWQERLEKTPAGDREAIVKQLLALGIRFRREGGGSADEAVLQLMDLAAVVLTSGEAAQQAFAEAGLVDGDAMARVTGAATSKVPVGSGERPADAVSPLGARLGATKK